MKRILFANQKGGVGKTMLADQAAFWLEKENTVSFIDLDQQGGAVHETNNNPKADYQVIDTPGALQKDMKDWFEAADVVVIPTNCNCHDMEPLKRMMDIAKDFDSKKIIVVFNRWNRFSGTAEFINWFSICYPGYKTILIPMSVALTDAAAREMSIADYKPKHKATEAVNSLMKVIMNTLGE